jgi:tetratricopeptide (TPR) repeat protein
MKLLTWSWKAAHIRGVEIRFHFSVLFTILAAYIIFRPASVHSGLITLVALMGFMLSIFLHEVGHALVAKLAGVEVKSIVIWFLGGFTNLSYEPEKPLPRLAIYAAGPFVTILLGVLFFILYFFLSLISFSYAQICLSLVTLNVILLIFNILPVYPLDGGRILQSLMELFFGKPSANLITMVISIPILIGLVSFGVYSHDYILLFFCIFIFLAISTLHQRTLRWVNLGLSYLFRRAGYYYLQGDYERAVQDCTRDIKRKPEQVNNYFLRAACYLHLLQNENALSDVQQALKIAPKNEMVVMLRGDICLIEGDSDGALEWYERAHEINANSALPYFGRGSVSLDKYEYQTALEGLNQAISRLTTIPLFYVVRSKVHYRLGNLEAAHHDQDSAVRLSEKDALTHADFNLRAYEGFLDWAEDYYARVLSKRPRSSYAYQGWAEVYYANHEYEKAIAEYTKALEINRREPRLYLGRGKCYLAVGEIDCAASDFRQVLAVTEKMHLRRWAEELLASLKSSAVIQ